MCKGGKSRHIQGTETAPEGAENESQRVEKETNEGRSGQCQVLSGILGALDASVLVVRMIIPLKLRKLGRMV